MMKRIFYVLLFSLALLLLLTSCNSKKAPGMASSVAKPASSGTASPSDELNLLDIAGITYIDVTGFNQICHTTSTLSPEKGMVNITDGKKSLIYIMDGILVWHDNRGRSCFPPRMINGTIYLPLNEAVGLFNVKVKSAVNSSEIEITSGENSYKSIPKSIPVKTPDIALLPVIEPTYGYLTGGLANGTWYYAAKFLAKWPDKPMEFAIYSLAGEIDKLPASPGGDNSKEEYDGHGSGCEVVIDNRHNEDRVDTIGLPDKWNAMPRKITTEKVSAVDKESIRKALQIRGIAEPEIEIEQVLSCDISGDGEKIVIITATTGLRNTADPQKDHYSIALVRNGKDQYDSTVLLCETYLGEGMQESVHFMVTGILDIDNDGKFEIAVDEKYHFGFTRHFFKLVDGAWVELFSGGYTID